MNTRILACALAAVVGLSGVAQACHGKGAGHHGKSIKGKITSVGNNSLGLAVAGSTGSQNVTVNFNSGSTKITGTAHRFVDSSMIGDAASVIGTDEDGTINASEIAISAGTHHLRGKIRA